ncbi:Glutathione S-transferase C-terminal domain-containing protein, partial [Camelus dromedarius]
DQFKKTLSYKEHMILCRFADQTAVQLPPQRRLIGMCSHRANVELIMYKNPLRIEIAPFAEGCLMIPFYCISGKQCMCLVDLDRARAAEERGYSIQVISMQPESCSPKNNMIVGVPI